MPSFPKLLSLFRHPTTFYVATTMLALLVTRAVVVEADSRFSVSNQQYPVLVLSILFPAIAFLWGARWIFLRLKKNKETASAVGDEKSASDQTFRALIAEQYGQALAENIMSYETFWRAGYQADLNRHTIATGIILGASVISISMGLLLFSDVRSISQSTSASVVIGALPALVTATALKVWLETRKNLTATREQVDILLRQRIRLITFWASRGQFPSSELFESHVHACNMFLNYIRAGLVDNIDVRHPAMAGHNLKTETSAAEIIATPA
jgi:hypothetical protein